MNILHISPNFNYSCGVSKHIYLLCKYWKKEFPNDKLFFITNQGDSIERLENIGIDVNYLNIKKDCYNPFILILSTIKLVYFCKKNRIQIIHTHHRNPELIANIAAIFIKVKTITTVHSYVRNLKVISFLSHRIIAVSNFIKNNLIQNYRVKENRLFMIYNFIEESENAAYTEKDFISVNNTIYILYAGRINKIKGADLLIKAFEQLSEVVLECKLFLVGNWELDDYYKSKIDSNKISYLGIKKNIENFIHSAQIIVIPSRVDPFPFMMLEAGLNNKPVVAARTGGIKEFIKDGVDGLLFEPGNVEDLKEKILSLISNKDLQKKLANNLYKKVKPLLDYKSYINKIRSIYES